MTESRNKDYETLLVLSSCMSLNLYKFIYSRVGINFKNGTKFSMIKFCMTILITKLCIKKC